MVLQTTEQCERFFNETAEVDLFFHVFPLEEEAHPAATTASLLFIKRFDTGERFIFPVEHPDAKTSVTLAGIGHEMARRHTGKKWALDKKALSVYVPWEYILDANLCGFLKKNSILDVSEFDTPAHHMVRRFAKKFGKINKTIPLMKHLEVFDELAESVEKMIRGMDIDETFIKVNNIIIGTLFSLESAGIHVDSELFQKHFETKPGENGLVYSQYNVYTSTGRPSNRFGGINYAALQHDDGSRNAFTSRYGDDGRIVVIDYSAFHPRIICMLTGYNVPIDTDIYAYLAQLYFRKEDVDETDISESKKLTFRQLYGGVEPKYQHIKYLAHLKTFIDNQWEFFKEHSYVETPVFKRKITDKHIQDPSPTKLFNYILQAVEGEIALSCLNKVIRYLNVENRKTKAILYTYDAVMYDFHREDGMPVLKEIQRLMSMDGLFPMKTYLGTSYQNVALVN
jgi:hypothetical protein